MKVTIKSLDGATLVLGDDASGEFVDDFLPDQGREVQTNTYIGATHAEYFDRGNRSMTVPFIVNKEHASRDAALAYAMSHADTVPVVGEVTFRQGSISRVFARAAINRVKFLFVKGKTTICSYNVTGGSITKI